MDKNDLIFKAIKLRLYPNQQQESLLQENCLCSGTVYNIFLRRNIDEYESNGKKLSYSEMCKELTALKQQPVFSYLLAADSTSLQQSLKNLDQGFQNFFRNIQQGRPAGHPTFKCKEEKTSFRVVMNIDVDNKQSSIKIGKHGWFSVHGDWWQLRNKKIRQITVKKEGDEWYASCLIKVPRTVHVHPLKECGIDVGVKQPLTIVYKNKESFTKATQTITLIEGINFSKELHSKEEKRKKYQRSLARKKKGSNNRKKARRRVTRAYRNERNFRRNWIEQTSFKLAETFEVIKFEDLKIRNMTKSAKGTVENPGTNVRAKSSLNREMIRLGLSTLILRTEQKANERGGNVIYINPKYTSQTCHVCGTVDKASRKSQAEFVCIHCGHTDNADRNAALNILKAA